MSLDELLQFAESPGFDRKRQFHANRVELLHDLLCLANAYHDADRYLLFGQTDSREIVGIENDPARIHNAQLHDYLRQCPLNRIPTLELRFEFVGSHQIGVLRIHNRPDKPFFLIRDKEHQGRMLRAGVVYSRLGDTNVPMGESAPEDHIELMWRERFGLGLDPLARFHRLLEAAEEWVELSETYRYHRRFPEFTVQRGRTLRDPFTEEWTQRFADPSALSYELDIRYLTTLLERWTFVSCDGHRYQIPLPRRQGDAYVLRADSPHLKLARQGWQYRNLDAALATAQITLI